MKICSICREEKNDNDFYSRGKGRIDTNSSCKKCFNSYCINRWIERKKDAISYKGNQCVDCDLRHTDNYYIFDFHHLDPSIKEKDWSKLRLTSWENITKELDQCVLLCSNCHRTRHWKLEMTPLGIEPR